MAKVQCKKCHYQVQYTGDATARTKALSKHQAENCINSDLNSKLICSACKKELFPWSNTIQGRNRAIEDHNRSCEAQNVECKLCKKQVSIVNGDRELTLYNHQYFVDKNSPTPCLLEGPNYIYNDCKVKCSHCGDIIIASDNRLVMVRNAQAEHNEKKHPEL